MAASAQDGTEQIIEEIFSLIEDRSCDGEDDYQDKNKRLEELKKAVDDGVDIVKAKLNVLRAETRTATTKEEILEISNKIRSVNRSLFFFDIA
eukprot:TRINITY_DN3886_c0_g1_i1.p1 TRINITY_DN3886_c0_g1~~TRINITY_DN3886_c0_g1_i1.p1  ORF type:complete len:101 (-),score=33.87 TRINITY_DN3886_c0_g1_i1:196-474(-)